jgi:hypothetical protein
MTGTVRHPIFARAFDRVSPDDCGTACSCTRSVGRISTSWKPAAVRPSRNTDLGELTQEQAAAQLGLSTSGMKSRVQRGRRLLQTEVGRCCRVALDARGALADAELRADTC